MIGKGGRVMIRADVIISDLGNELGNDLNQE
jgi:hypothetical protein